ncbi:MAG: endonuclease/exonuclease/phosphatase family protein [Candidatus Binatus sp.]
MRDISLSVLSWNLHGLAWPLSRDPGGRMDRVAEKIHALAPEVVLLQEVWLGAHVSRLARILEPDWTPVCVSRRIGGPRGGLLAFVSAAAGWRVRGSPQFHAFATSAPAWKIWQGDGLGGKGVLTVQLERDDMRISAVDTHLQSQYSGVDYSAVRQAQLIEVREVVARLGQAQPAIVAGDFNTDTHERLYSQVAVLGTDLTADARKIYQRGTTANHRNKLAEWIDYIIAANAREWVVVGDLKLIANQRADVPYSDHSGLFCTLRMVRRQ